jgi:TolA-binding protein
MNMKRYITLIVGILLVGGFISQAILAATKTERGKKIQNVEVQLKDLKIDQAAENIKALKQQLQDAHGDKKVIEDLNNKIQQQEIDLEAARQAKAQKVEAQRLAAEKAAQAQATLAIVPKASAATGSCAELSTKLSRLGLHGDELSAAITLATRESSCRSAAVNASSGACGEFQSYPCGKWGSPGTDQYLLNAIKYARDRYGSYTGALAFSYANNWY